jgi:hypothetical protein
MHTTIARLIDIMNRHDATEMATLFSPDYRSAQPAHPDRGFGGAAQVRKNWSQLFEAVPDMRLELLADTDDGETAWTEWRWTGTRANGRPFGMSGVIIFGLGADGLVTWAHLYMEEVEEHGLGIDAAVRRFAEGSSRKASAPES